VVEKRPRPLERTKHDEDIAERVIGGVRSESLRKPISRDQSTADDRVRRPADGDGPRRPRPTE